MERGNSVRNIALFIGLPRAAIDRALGRVLVAADFLKLRRRLRICSLRQKALRVLVFSFVALRAPRQADRQRQAQRYDQQERQDAFEMSRHVRSSFQNYSYTNYNMIYL